ncbi:MAG: glycosyltransferase family 4 protein [Bacteroidetes bacterium]|nr:glycosyltransferase family 4 protein [Bacteroidota bacterium]
MANKPLIAIFCSSFPPEGGGASNRIYNLAVLLRDSGYRVQVVAAMPNYPTGKIFPSYKGKIILDETVGDILVRRVWISPSNSASALARGWSMASFILSLRTLAFGHILKAKPALVIVSSPPLPMAAAAIHFFKKRRSKVLLNVSDIWPLSAHALGALKPSLLYRHLEKMATGMYRSADAITTQSSETLEHIKALLPSLPEAMVYRNLPRQSVHVEAQINHVTGRVKRIIYPGVLGHAQGLLSLCQAIDFGSLGICLEIYGAGAERESIQSFAAANPHRGIFLLDPVSPEVLSEKLSVATAVLVPLIAPINGALPSKLFTAMYAGRPVLYSGGGEGEQLVLEHGLGFVAAPGDYNTISGNIRNLVAMDDEALGAWRKRILAIASLHFNKEIQDQQLLSLLSNIMAR